MKRNGTVIALFLAACMIFFYISSLKGQLSEAHEVNASYKKEVRKLSVVNEAEAREANRSFLKRFFNYQDIQERNAEIKPLMTAQGFQNIQMTASQQKERAEIHVFSNNLEMYEKRDSKTAASFINELDLSIDFNGVNTTEKTMIRTKLVYVQGQGWKVDQVEFTGNKGIKD